MLSRRHVRIKVMQALYSYQNEGEKNLDQLGRQLERNVTKLYDLYLYLLLFLEELGNYMVSYDEQVKARYVREEDDQKAIHKLFNNPILQKLMNSDSFHNTAAKYKVQWNGDEDILRRIYLDLKNQEAYTDFVKAQADDELANREVLIFILKQYTSTLSIFQQHIEEQFINWADDKKIAIQMAQKTVQVLSTDSPVDFLLPVGHNSEELYEYADQLLKKTIEQDEKLKEIISSKITKWEPHMVAVIDYIILKMAISEFLNFPSIPSTVTINEYIELAKSYSTPQSKKFINGVLDAVQKDLRKEGILIKN
jgi:N utilization substance protein B